jgi:hypothetical protein
LDPSSTMMCTPAEYGIIAPLNHTEVELFLDLYPGKQGQFISPILPSLHIFLVNRDSEGGVGSGLPPESQGIGLHYKRPPQTVCLGVLRESILTTVTHQVPDAQLHIPRFIPQSD